MSELNRHWCPVCSVFCSSEDSIVDVTDRNNQVKYEDYTYVSEIERNDGNITITSSYSDDRKLFIDNGLCPVKIIEVGTLPAEESVSIQLTPQSYTWESVSYSATENINDTIQVFNSGFLFFTSGSSYSDVLEHLTTIYECEE